MTWITDPAEGTYRRVLNPGGRRTMLLRAFLRNPEGRLGLLILLFWLVIAAFPDVLVGRLETAITASGGFMEGPSSVHILGTDEIGRDILNLVVHGARVSLTIGILATVVAISIGTTVGLVAGYFGGLVDSWLMRLTDLFFVMPAFVLALIITPIALELVGRSGEVLGFRISVFVVILVIGLTSWAFVARIVRSQALSLRERPFVDRARVAGTGHLAIMTRHILPNLIPHVAADAALVVAGAIAIETSLSFIGLGDPIQPSWGTLLYLAQQSGAASIGAWWYVGAPGACVLLVVTGFVLIGNALDDTLNPRRRAIP